MGLLRDMALLAAIGAGEEVAHRGITAAGDALGKAGKKISKASKAIDSAVTAIKGTEEEQRMRRDAGFMAQRPNNTFYYVQLLETGLPSDVAIIDQEDNEPFVVSGSMNALLFDLRVSHANGSAIGRIKKDLISLRMPLVHERNPANYNIIQGDDVVATVKTKITPNGRKYDVQPFGWRIASPTTLVSDYSCKRDGQTLFSISKRPGYQIPTYLIDYENPSFSSVAILMSLAVIYDDHFRV